MNNLSEALTAFEFADYPTQSRCHPLNSFPKGCFVKRDDELGFGVAGSKIRKYSSLIPHLLKNNYEEALLIGGPNSNHIVGFSQLLIENRIIPRLFLRKAADEIVRGNALLTSLLVDTSQVHWVSRMDWSNVENIVNEFQQSHPLKSCIIPEGGFMKECLPGALTLPLDILRNESQWGFQFDHIFVDAGTGLMAIATILGLATLNHPAAVHVLSLADNQEVFDEKLKKFETVFANTMGFKPPKINNLTFHIPQTNASFGSTSPQVFKEIVAIARNEGFFTDPIYSAKLFVESKRIIHENNIKGNILIIQSGGALTLFGFQDQLQRH